MKYFMNLLGFYLSILALPPCFAESSQFSQEKVVTNDSLERAYWLYRPKSPKQKPALVVVMHGYSGNAKNIAAYSGMNSLADEHGFLVAYPQGSIDSRGNAFFNVGYQFHADSKIDDVAYIKAMVKQIQERFSVEQNQIFATGMSNGGDMIYLLACRTGNLFRAFAPVAGSMMASLMNNCDFEVAPPILAISGTDDPVTLHAGDMNNIGGWGPYGSQQDTIAFWVERQKLKKVSATPLANTHQPLLYEDSRIIVERYASANENKALWYYRIEGGGHDWPGARLGRWYYPPRYFALFGIGFGKNQDIDASREIWRFFNHWIAHDAGKASKA
jgi:polyhydroxybutyrate depolymerase